MNTSHIKRFLLVLPVLLIAFAGCQNKNEMYKNNMQSGNVGIQKAIAVIHPLNNSGVHGIVYFTKVPDGIKIVADINGLTQGKHGFHIHEYGDLRNDDGTSAGGHFNPYGKPHGAPGAKECHVGDMGNIVATNKVPTAHYIYTDSLMSFSGVNSIIGRSVIIHQGEDDLTSQPSGNAGKRIAGGVIGIANGSL